MRTGVVLNGAPSDCCETRRWHALFTSLPPFFLALLPKCPLCLGAYLSAAGLGALQGVARHPLTVALLIALLLLHVRTVYRRSRQTDTIAALSLSLAGTAALLGGAVFWNVRSAALAGAILIAVGSLLNGRTRPKRSILDGVPSFGHDVS